MTAAHSLPRHKAFLSSDDDFLSSAAPRPTQFPYDYVWPLSLILQYWTCLFNDSLTFYIGFCVDVFEDPEKIHVCPVRYPP